MARFDAEDLLDGVLQIMTENDALNTKIAAVEAEKVAKGKGVSPTLAQVSSDAYHLQTWSDKILQKNPAIFYGIEDVSNVSSGAHVNAITYKVFVEVILVDNGMTNDYAKRLQRYSRALEELFAEQFKPAMNVGTVEIEQVRPIAFKNELNTNDEVLVGGVSLKVTIA